MAAQSALTLAALVLQIVLVRTAAAHDFWIEPSTFRPSPGDALALRLRVGERFVGEPVPRDETMIRQFVAIGAGRDARVIGRDGSDPAGVVALAAPGLWTIGYASRPSSIEIEAGKFEGYLQAEGLDAVSRLRAARGESAAPGRERFSRCAKSLLLVGSEPAAASSMTVPLGLTLEIVPEKDPYALAPGNDLPVRLLYDGRPFAGALVTALNRDRPSAAVAMRTDGSGRATMRLAEPGVWLVKAVHMDVLPPGGREQYESYWASLTFELAAVP